LKFEDLLNLSQAALNHKPLIILPAVMKYSGASAVTKRILYLFMMSLSPQALVDYRFVFDFHLSPALPELSGLG